MKPYHSAVLAKAHDVRTLRSCDVCDGLGNKDLMLEFREHTGTRYRHGRCHIRVEGWPHFLTLPREQHDRLTLEDLGLEHMKALLLYLETTNVVTGPTEGTPRRNQRAPRIAVARMADPQNRGGGR